MSQLQLDFTEDEDPAFDWADPDLWDEEIATARWYSVSADPYARDDIDDPAPCEFYLGTHRIHWLHPGRAREDKPSGPLFVSARQLRRRKSPYPAGDTDFAVDSGGFTELSKFGRWTVGAEQYAIEVRSWARELGFLRWAAIQDWMCEPWIIEGGAGPAGGAPAPGTGLTVEQHQELTVRSYLDLRALAPEIRWLPVIQGQSLADYLAHVDMYSDAGICLAAHACVGVGSVCRRQSTAEIVPLLDGLARAGLRMHGFGVKAHGLARAAGMLVSADSLAWSYAARKQAHLPGHSKSDANSQRVAEAWRAQIQSMIATAAYEAEHAPMTLFAWAAERMVR